MWGYLKEEKLEEKGRVLGVGSIWFGGFLMVLWFFYFCFIGFLFCSLVGKYLEI